MKLLVLTGSRYISKKVRDRWMIDDGVCDHNKTSTQCGNFTDERWKDEMVFSKSS
jgi:hypothetical protein